MFKIGFADSSAENHPAQENVMEQKNIVTARRSLVQVYFPDRKMHLSYYNDLFDLHVGDMVYVDGKLEGLQGFVTEVSYNFKIKASDYHKVIYVVDTDVSGQFFLAGSHLVSFNRNSIPYEKTYAWFCVPNSDEEYVSGFDDSSFPLDDLKQMNISKEIAERGHDYYLASRVRYVSLDGTKGRAIVKGSKAYQVEFEYCDGLISHLTCNCFCSYSCKHEFAAMIQLKETLDIIMEHYKEQYLENKYFAAVERNTLMQFALENREYGSISFN